LYSAPNIFRKLNQERELCCNGGKNAVSRQLGVDMVDEPWPSICVVDVLSEAVAQNICCEGRRYLVNSNVDVELVTLS